MKKETNIGKAASEAGKNAAEFFGKAKKAIVTSVDKNGDGKLGFDDVSIVTDSVKGAVKEKSDRISLSLEQKKKDKEYKELRPLFDEDVDKPDFALPKLIRVAAMDSRHASSEICKGSIGFIFESKDMDVITIYPNKITDFRLKFDPDMESEMYYIDPTDRDHYISLETYFDHLRIARISELQNVARDLGAKHFRVIYEESNSNQMAKDIKIKSIIKVPGSYNSDADYEKQRSEANASKFEVAAEMEFIGHKPVEPELFYFRNDPQIQSLVSSRLAENSMTHQVYRLNLSSSSGIKMNDALKIDAAINAMKIKGNSSVTSAVQKEKNSFFEYEIDF